MHTSNPKHITGTADDGLVFPHPCHLRGVVVGTGAAGATLALHDCATEGAAAPGNQVASIAIDDPGMFDFFNTAFAVGLVAIVSDDCDVTVIWG